MLTLEPEARLRFEMFSHAAREQQLAVRHLSRPGALSREEVAAHAAELLARGRDLSASVRGVCEALERVAAAASEGRFAPDVLLWYCSWRTRRQLTRGARLLAQGGVVLRVAGAGPSDLNNYFQLMSEYTTMANTFLDDWPVVVIPPWAFLRSMLVIAWSAFRHPFTTTVIDLSTGKELAP